MSTLRRFPLLQEFSDDDLEHLGRIMVTETHRRGHVFMREGAGSTSVRSALYLILDGTVEVTARRPEGGYAVQRTMGAGEMFGMVGLLADGHRSATVTAADRVQTAKLEKQTFDLLFRRNVGLHARFQLAVARQLAADIRNLRKLVTHAIDTGDATAVAEHFR